MLRFNLVFSILALAVSATGWSQSHALIDQQRSSYRNNVFVVQSLEGEYGRIAKKTPGSDVAAKQSWRGYGVRNGLGVEVFKFTQFSLSHTMLNLRSKDTSLEHASGSRLAGEVALVFSAPLANIQFGFGLTGTHLDYQNLAENATYVGAGHYFSGSLNYFITHHLSFQLVGKRLESDLSKNSGNYACEAINTHTDNLGIGIALWF